MAKILAGLEAAGPDKKEALARARVAVHGVNLQILQQAVEPPAPPPKSDEKDMASPRASLPAAAEPSTLTSIQEQYEHQEHHAD
jgi:hypothetical protein